MNRAEGALYAHLTETDGLDYLAHEGMLSHECLQVIPTELGRKIVHWCLDRYFEARRMVAPSREAIMAEFGDAMEAVDIAIIDDVETDSVQVALAELRNNHLHFEFQKWIKDTAQVVYNQDSVSARSEAIRTEARKLERVIRLSSLHTHEIWAGDGLTWAVQDLDQRRQDGPTARGMTFGLPELDDHLLGIHPGEVCTFAGGAGAGKSFWAIWCALKEYEAGRRVYLATLENSPEETFDRMACMALRINYERWQRGDVAAHEMDIVRAYVDKIKSSDCQPIVVQLRMREATPSQIWKRANSYDAVSVISDQVSFMTPDEKIRGAKRTDEVREMMRSIRDFSKEFRISSLLLNQINREGVQAARKTGRYFKEHLAESAWVEQSSDVVYALYQSQLMYREQRAQLQQLKGRRTTERHWELVWRPEVGDIRIEREVHFDDG
jgi:archaellum biogenesis ATPase FlaH